MPENMDKLTVAAVRKFAEADYGRHSNGECKQNGIYDERSFQILISLTLIKNKCIINLLYIILLL